MPLAKGERHPKARLTNEQVRLIRYQNKVNGVSHAKLAKEFNCGVSTVRDIVTLTTRKEA